MAARPGGIPGWVGPYINPPLASSGSTLSSISKDAWNHDYRLTFEGSSYLEIRSPALDGTFDTDDDIAVEVEVTFIRRRITLEELEIINTAIRAYNEAYLAEDPLRPDWSLAETKTSSLLSFFSAGTGKLK